MCSASCHVNKRHLYKIIVTNGLSTHLSGSSPVTLYVNSDLRKKEISSNLFFYTVTVKKKNQQAHS